MAEFNVTQTKNKKTFRSARSAKKDEFYTQEIDICNEMRHYRDHFKDKVVYCNCDDPTFSGFFQYFKKSFNRLGIKKLITTCYKNQNKSLLDRTDLEKAISLIYEGTDSDDNLPPDEEIIKNCSKSLEGDGDFRSSECINLLRQADIVVTNPPFSLFREYVAQLIENDKKFLIIGHQNAISYKEIFRLFQDGKIWIGHGFKGNVAHFISYYEDYAKAGDHKEGLIRVSGVTWFTNLDHHKRNRKLILYKDYSADEYPKYDGYDIINVDKVSEIPKDYFDPIGVPITFMYKFNPDQFEILGSHRDTEKKCFYVNGQAKYARIIIRRKN